MKAVLLKQPGGIENFVLEEVAKPAIQPGEVLIRIKAASFNPVDYQIRKGLPESRGNRSGILGRDLSGIVEEVPPGESEFKKGDAVFGYIANLGSNGTYAEYISVPSALLAHKPGFLTHEQAAAVPVAGITASMILSKINRNKRVSVFVAGGAGGVGTFVMLFSRYRGIQNLVTTGGNDKSIKYLMRHLGLHPKQVINYKEGNMVETAIQKNGGLFDVAIDLVGGDMLSACCHLLALDGSLISVVDAPGKDDFDRLFHKNASFHPVGANAYSLSVNKQHLKTYKRILSDIATLFDLKRISAPPITVVGHLSAETVKSAHDLLENHSVQGKLVMTC